VVTIYFITKFPRTVKQHDSIMVVVDKLTKETHFIHMKTTHKETNIANIYMKELSRLHGVPKEIVSEHRFQVYIQILARFVQRIWDKSKS
jgi:2-hydroxy-3-keto-5-methylthiopentenyl-1-phosphate phosphatase